MRSRAVSPVIASILLIAIVLVLIGVFVVWGQSFTKEKTQEIETVTAGQVNCAYAGVRISDCNFFNGSDKIVFRLNNTGSINLSEFTVSVFDGTNLVKGTYSKVIAPGTFQLFDSSVTTSFTLTQGTMGSLTAATKVRVTPTACPSNYDEVIECSTG
jgi:flagellin-like protein